MTAIPTSAQLLRGNPSAAKFAAPGDTIEGFVKDWEVKLVLKDNGEPDLFPSGDPKYQINIRIQTNLRDPQVEEDDGERTLYAKSYMFAAVKQAIAASGAPDLEKGGWIRVTYTEDGVKKNPMHSAPKLFAAEYRRPSTPVANEQQVAHQISQAYTPGQQQAPQGYAAGQGLPQQGYQQPAQQSYAQPQTAYAQTAPQQAAPAQPDSAAIEALRQAGMDDNAIRAIYPHWNGQG